MYIALEGLKGCGKSTVFARLPPRLREHGVDPVSMPADFLVLETLPVTAVGKLDKVRLREIAALPTPEGDPP